jgi:hypothetical protein
MDEIAVPLDVAERIERVEAEMMLDLTRAAPDDLLQEVAIDVFRIGSAHAFLMREIDWIMYNRLLGLGVGEPATKEMVDLVAKLYRRTWMLFSVQVSPLAQPADLHQWLTARGIRREERYKWVKFYRGVEPPPDAPTEFRVERVEDEDQAISWVVVARMAWYLHGALRLWLLRTIGRPGWHHYLAYDGATPVACSALYVHDRVGWLGFTGTLNHWQGRGAQSALITRRIRDAADLGCRWLTVETKEETPRRPNHSYRNMLRAGFQIAYLRPNYRLTREIKRRPYYDDLRE